MRLALACLACAGGIVAAAPGPNVVRVEHRDPATAPTRGHVDAPVTVEYFFLPQLPASQRLAAFRPLERLYAKHPGRIRLIYRVIKGPGAVQMPVAALEAHAQGKFFELIEALHQQRSSTTVTKEQVLEIARGIGMDASRLAAAISDGRYSDAIVANERRLARMKQGQGPFVVMNSRVVTAVNDAELETEYGKAYDRAQAMIEQGYSARELPKVFDEQARQVDDQPPVRTRNRPREDDEDDEDDDQRLASPPLELQGLPSFGNPDAVAPTPIVVLCRPNDPDCVNLVRIVLRLVQDVYTDETRAIWAPFFDVQLETAWELAMLADAALCAEQVGSSPEELYASPGWRWISKQLEQAGRWHGRKVKPNDIIDAVANELDVDGQRLSACRARMANASLDFVARARRSGVRNAPSVVVGGRIYSGRLDESTLRRLIEAELAPGVLGDTADGGFERLLFFLSSPKGK